MNDYPRQLLNTLFLLAGSALLALASPRPIQLPVPRWIAAERAGQTVPSCVAPEAGAAPDYLDAVALSLANSDGPAPVDAGCGTPP